MKSELMSTAFNDSGDLSQEARRTCASVARNATHVRINRDAIGRVVRDELRGRIGADGAIFPAVPEALGREACLNYALMLQAFNFGSWADSRDLRSVNGSLFATKQKALLGFFQSCDDVVGVLKSDPKKFLLGAFPFLFSGGATFQRQKAELLADHMDVAEGLGAFFDKFEGVGISSFFGNGSMPASQMLSEISKCSAFRDCSMYKGELVWFLKKAQLAVTHISNTFNVFDGAIVPGVDQLTIYADNGVPFTLRNLGILEFDDKLASDISRRNLIVAGSDEEVEIRACSIVVCAIIAGELEKLIPSVNERMVDSVLWKMARETSGVAAFRHRCRTIFY